jgi:hypothetical protein
MHLSGIRAVPVSDEARLLSAKRALDAFEGAMLVGAVEGGQRGASPDAAMTGVREALASFGVGRAIPGQRLQEVLEKLSDLPGDFLGLLVLKLLEKIDPRSSEVCVARSRAGRCSVSTRTSSATSSRTSTPPSRSPTARSAAQPRTPWSPTSARLRQHRDALIRHPRDHAGRSLA